MSLSKSVKHCRQCICIPTRQYNSGNSSTADLSKMATKIIPINQWKILNQLKEHFFKFSNDKNFQQFLNKELAAILQKLQPSVYGSNVIRDFETITKEELHTAPNNKKPENQKPVNNNKEGYSLPNVLTGLKLKMSQKENPAVGPKWKRTPQISKCSVNSRTFHVISMINTAETDSSKLRRIDDLIGHLQQYPEAKHHAFKEGAVKLLLRIRNSSSNVEIQGAINEAFAVLGYLSPLPKKGIRILSIDGGGTRGLLVIYMLKKLEELTGRPVHEMFDLVCGVSTGAIIACGLGASHKTLMELEKYYKELSIKIFSQNAFWGTSNLVWSHSYYDTKVWEQILKDFFGDVEMIKTSRKQNSPKVLTVSAVVNQSRTNVYVFRNYSLPYRIQSQYMGSSKHKIWEAVRASAAAPTYFEEFKLGNLLLQDGGIMVNNPTAVAVHEARQLWPNKPIQCVVSFGTGRTNHNTDPIDIGNSTSWKNKFLKILDSATDTESVHMTLNDLLPANTYYRFNPYLTEMLDMSEIRSEKLDMLERDALMYLRRNEDKFQAAAKTLLEGKRLTQQVLDWVHIKRESIGI